eukprot:jgi/Tetstr1/422830/TSEL_013621.t1
MEGPHPAQLYSRHLRQRDSSSPASEGSPVMPEAEFSMEQLAQMHMFQQQQHHHQQQLYQQQQANGGLPLHNVDIVRSHSSLLAAHLGQHLHNGEGSSHQAAFFGSMSLMGDPLAPGSLFDPTGSLSHIDLSGFSAPTADAPTSHAMAFQAPFPSHSHGLGAFRPGDEVKPEPPPVSPFAQAQAQAQARTDVRHPEVGDIIGTADVDHSAIIMHFNDYANRVGFCMTRNFDNMDTHGRYKRVRIQCKQSGMPRKTARHDNPAMQRERTSQKGLDHGPCPRLGNVCHPLSKTHDGIHKDAQEEIKAQIKRTQLEAAHPKRGAAQEPDALRAAAGRPRATCSLARFLSDRPPPVPAEQRGEMALLLLDLTSACKRVAEAVASASCDAADGPLPPQMCAVANVVIKTALSSVGCVNTLSTSLEPDMIEVDDAGHFLVVVDPLMGADGLDVGAPCGTVFGVYSALEAEEDQSSGSATQACLQPGRKLVAAGYVLYSHATTLILTLGDGAHGFTLDRAAGEFVLSKLDIRVPQRGESYAIQDADPRRWSDALAEYVAMVSQGTGQSKTAFRATHAHSLLADFHAALLRGGVVVDPCVRSRLVHRGNPLSFIMEQAGGTATDGKTRLLELQPRAPEHETALCFGSHDDMEELVASLTSGTSTTST